MMLYAQRLTMWLASSLLGALLCCSVAALGQTIDTPNLQLGTIVGTAMDVNGDPVPNAGVVLEGTDPSDRRTVVANENGYFEFHAVKPGIPYHANITADGFSPWTSPGITLESSQFKILTDIKLQVQLARTTVYVTQTPAEVATEQVKLAEKQRVFGIIPNFYVVYDPDPVPLTTKLKFRLALKIASDPVTAAGVAFLSATQQAGDTPNYGQGWDAYGKRIGANSADGFSDIMIGGAILPSLLHQDPRYFYRGTGTNKARLRHAMLHPFICPGDNGRPQPNYSSLGGDLAASAISNLYYPKSNRGVGLVLTNFGLSTAERVATSLAQEFLLRRFVARNR
jgi:Carboxypeptidase regulatory-like domain